MDETLLKMRVEKTSPTVRIMDEFESVDDAFRKKYASLELCDLFCIKYRRRMYWISLIVQRRPKKQPCIPSTLTFTQLKNELLGRVFTLDRENSYPIVQELFRGIRQNWQCESDDIEVTFPVPVQFSAQNSGNRSGYGNRFRGEVPVYEGTLYGETTDYQFVGARYRRWR